MVPLKGKLDQLLSLKPSEASRENRVKGCELMVAFEALHALVSRHLLTPPPPGLLPGTHSLQPDSSSEPAGARPPRGSVRPVPSAWPPSVA